MSATDADGSNTGPPMGGAPDTGISALGKQVLGVSWGLTAASFVFLMLRVYSKTARGRGLWWDDHVLIVAWICLCTASATSTVEVQLGLGKHIGEVIAINPANIVKFFFLEQFTATFSIFTALWSKTSFAVTLLRLAKGWVRWAVWFIIVSMNILMLTSALFVWIQCTPVARNWDRDVPGTCWDPNVLPTFNIITGAYSGVMDITLALLPWTIIMNLQMKKKEKFGVAIAMSMGVFAGVTAFIKCSKLPALASGDFTFDGTQLTIWGSAEAATTIIATSIPVLRALFSDVSRHTNRYFRSGGKDTVPSNVQRSGLGGTTIVANRSRSNDDWLETGSDKSILAGNNMKIFKTAEITVDHDSPRDGEMGYAMTHFDRAAPAPRHGRQGSQQRM